MNSLFSLQEYSQWITGLPAPDHWQYFGTITEHRPRSSRSWRKGLETFFNKPQPNVRHSTEHRPTKHFWAMERHKSGSFHAHFLLYYKDDYKALHEARKEDLWNGLFLRFGRSQVLTYQPDKGAVAYVTKYCFKEGFNTGFEWDFRC